MPWIAANHGTENAVSVSAAGQNRRTRARTLTFERNQQVATWSGNMSRKARWFGEGFARSQTEALNWVPQGGGAGEAELPDRSSHRTQTTNRVVAPLVLSILGLLSVPACDDNGSSPVPTPPSTVVPLNAQAWSILYSPGMPPHPTPQVGGGWYSMDERIWRKGGRERRRNGRL
jgi:hypothetical protein